MQSEKKVLVTGGAGYVGSHTCKLLRQHGFTPFVIDNFSTGFPQNIQWGPYFDADLRDSEKIRPIFEANDFSGVMHFAASAYVGESVENPINYFENNVSTTINIVKLCEEYGIDKFVFSSSCATYGSPEEFPIQETTPQVPINPYGESKLMCEKIIESQSNAGKLQYVGLRYFNAVGADLEGEIGEEHKPETHVIPRIIQSILNRSTFEIYGSDYNTVDGTCIRDFVHVSDLARAHVKALNYLINDGKSIFLNLGTGIGLSILQLLKAFEKYGLQVDYRLMDKRPGDPAMLVSSYKMAAEVLGWRPENSDIDTVIQSAYKWELLKTERH